MGLAPYLSPLGLPEAERDAAGNLTQSLCDLSSFEEKFRLALEMFD